jgi:hypothetical protein
VREAENWVYLQMGSLGERAMRGISAFDILMVCETLGKGKSLNENEKRVPAGYAAGTLFWGWWMLCLPASLRKQILSCIQDDGRDLR